MEWYNELPWSGTAHVFHFPDHFTHVGDFDSESHSYKFKSSYDDWPTVYYMYKKDVPFKFKWDNERQAYVFSLSASLQRPEDVASGRTSPTAVVFFRASGGSRKKGLKKNDYL